MSNDELFKEYGDHLVEQVTSGKMTRRELLVRASIAGISVSAVGSLLAACGSSSSPSSSSSSVKEGGVLRIGTQYIPNSMNPFVAYMITAYNTFAYIYPQLVAYDTTNRNLPIMPGFAQKWETTSDDLTWTFHTVPNVKWSDGQPLTARDAAFTINTTVKYGSGPAANIATLVTGVKEAVATDANTLVVHLTAPNAVLLARLAKLSILPEHVWSQYATGNGSQLKTFPNNAPIVSGGPFMLTAYVPNDHLLCQRNPQWWGPKPHIDGFGVEFFSSQDAEILALKNNQIDYVTPLPPTSVTSMRDAGMTVNDVPGLLVHEIDLNSSPYMKEHRELLIPNVRLAFAHALDIQKFISVAYLGHAEAAGSWIPPAAGGGWNDPNLKPETFDLALAAQLLDQAGCKLGPNGVRYYNGAKMEYNVVFPNDEQGPGSRVFQIYQADLATIGIIVHQQSVDDTTAYTLIAGPDNKYRNFQIAQWSWTAEIDPDFMLSVLTTSQWGALADTGFTNPTYDKLYEEQGKEMNAAKRRAIVWKMQEIIYKDKPYIPTLYSNWLEAMSPKWAGFIVSPRGSWNNLSMQTLLSVHAV